MAATDRRAQLLDTALNFFSQQGFDRTTTKEIAAAAGVTEAIVFRHFPTKHALYQAVLEHQSDCPGFREWMEEARRRMERNDDEGLMRAIAEAVLEQYRSDPRMERLMLFAALEGQEAALNHHRSVTLPIYQLFREYIERRQREGALLAFHPAAILSAIAGMAQRYGVYTRLFGFPPELSDEEAAETFTRILMDGIKPRANQ
jgi:TetR/AcrR family transcriptional regulator